MKCPNCGIQLIGSMRRCPKCGFDTVAGEIDNDYLKKIDAQKEEEIQEKKRIQEEREQAELELKREAEAKAELKAQMPTLRAEFKTSTTNEIAGYSISLNYGVKTGEAVLGTGFLSEFSASVTDFLGSESFSMSYKLNQAKQSALRELVDNCIIAGGNAAVGVRVDITTLGANMLVASACGTAVKIEKNK